MLKFVSLIHPDLISTEWVEIQKERHWQCLGPKASQVLVGCYFIVTRALLVFLAVVAFAMKLLTVCLKLIGERYKFWMCFVETALLMNQVLGCVLFEQLLQDRIFLFIFGGQDSDCREDELALKDCYRIRLVKQIWEHYWQKASPFKD